MKNLYDLSGKTALVTGASSGLGKRMSECLSAAGARVIICGRSEERLNALEKKLTNAKAMAFDVTDRMATEKAIGALDRANEKIDICIANAGIGDKGNIFDEDQDDHFLSCIQTNLLGIWYTTKYVANHMKSHDIAGSIIHISSIRGEGYPLSKSPGYSASKAAVSHLAKTLVKPLAAYKIRINCIAPGWFRTPLTEGPKIADIISKIPCGFAAEPKDLDALILFLSSNQASAYVTGSNFTIDGGMSCISDP